MNAATFVEAGQNCWGRPGGMLGDPRNAGKKRRYFGSPYEGRSISSGVNKRGRCPVVDSDPLRNRRLDGFWGPPRHLSAV